MVQQTDIDAAVRDTHIPAAKHWIGGKQVDASDGNVMANTSPIDGKPLGALARGTHEDIDRAVASARAAYEDGRWSGMAPAARKEILHRVADLIEQHLVGKFV